MSQPQRPPQTPICHTGSPSAPRSASTAAPSGSAAVVTTPGPKPATVASSWPTPSAQPCRSAATRCSSSTPRSRTPVPPSESAASTGTAPSAPTPTPATGPRPNWIFVNMISPEGYLAESNKWIDEFGLQIVGGCCGIGIQHVELLKSGLTVPRLAQNEYTGKRTSFTPLL